jgi:hypothetical protein
VNGRLTGLETPLVELDIDEESTILFDNTHRTLQNNARLLEGKAGTNHIGAENIVMSG